ncbi:peptidylprolyl isomerase [Dysosmobacter sp.]|uniref:peptidylprolyl isomerase n=1 Tax=Dysosmobacter sp. TaxID=2591382 RepID=UPI002A884457|nr:peptidylprolyl isomerase [Dysosmobacter sp.]MDY3281096.1 peptidylprolyl isomerase [Dysosmobacter sp.]
MSAIEKNPNQEPEVSQELLQPETSPASRPDKKSARTAREAKQRKEERRSNILYASIAVIFVVVAASALIWNSGVLQRGTTAAVVNGEKYSASEVQYYFGSVYQSFINNNYYYLSYLGLDTTRDLREQTCAMDASGITWFDYFSQQALQQMSHVHALAAKAEAEGLTWNDEMQAIYDNNMAQLEANTLSYNQAQNTNLSVKDYISKLYGQLVTQSVYEKQLKKAIQAQVYANHFAESLDYTEDQLEAVYAADPKTYDRADYESVRVKGTVPTTTDANGNTVEVTDAEKAQAKADAKALADQIYASFQGGAALSSLADGDKAIYTDGTHSSYYSSTLMDWVFDDSRSAGDSAVLFDETSTAYYVVVFHDRYRDEYNTVNVRHILIQPETGEKAVGEEGYEEEAAQLNADAKAKAQDLLAQWKAGAATEDSFAQLAVENSADGGSAAQGGLYTQVYQGEMVPAFNDWCFDSARRTGDTDVVETDYGYHIMYFVGKDMPYWQLQATNALMNEDCSAWYAENTADASYEVRDGGMKYVG